jgi:hypothetical protein
MTNEEQAAFVKAYARHIAHVPREHVVTFVRKYNDGEVLSYSSDYVNIIDALSMWHEAIKFNLEKTNELQPNL